MDTSWGAPPRYSKVAGTGAYLDGEPQGLVVGPSENCPILDINQPQTSTNQPQTSSNQPRTPPAYQEPIPPPHSNFDIVGFILCWTGSTTECYSHSGIFCGLWYIFLGIFGIINIILPYLVDPAGLPVYLSFWYLLAGISCVLLCLMWCYTRRFSSKARQYYNDHDTHNHRIPEHVNTGCIICCFMVSCGFFGGIATALFHNIIFIGYYVYTDEQYVPLNVIVITFFMAIVVIIFLCLNCLCYRCCVKQHAGNIC